MRLFKNILWDQFSYSIDRCFILHLNKSCVYPHLENLFIKKDITEEVHELQSRVKDKVGEFQQALSRKELPNVHIGLHCNRPYECRFKSQCWGSVPKPSVLDVPEMGALAWDYYHQDKIRLEDLPDEELLPRQKIYKKVHLCEEPYIDKECIQKELSSWKKPLYYLDFETINPAIPRFEGGSPFQFIPFQFSALCIF